MISQKKLPIPPQENVITLSAAQQRVANWSNFIKQTYGKQSNNFPHASFIEFVDILELASLQKQIREIPDPSTGELQTIYIVAVRSYYSMSNPVTNHEHLTATEFPLESLLVPVYQTDFRQAGSPEEFLYNAKFPTFDLILPVPSAAKNQMEEGGEDDVSIYDMTLPCPVTCDPNSIIYGP